MKSNPFVLLVLALAVCVVVAWALPAGLDALKHSLSPGAPPEQPENAAPTGQTKGPAEGPVLAPSLPDIPSN